MYIPISESWLSSKLFINLSDLTQFESIVILLLANILFYISFKFFYNIIRDVFRCITRFIKGVLR